jgi:hypothetical protein
LIRRQGIRSVCKYLYCIRSCILHSWVVGVLRLRNKVFVSVSGFIGVELVEGGDLVSSTFVRETMQDLSFVVRGVEFGIVYFKDEAVI